MIQKGLIRRKTKQPTNQPTHNGRVPSMDLIELFKHLTVCKQMIDVELFVLHSDAWNHLTVWKQMSSGMFKYITYKLFFLKSYFINRIWD